MTYDKNLAIYDHDGGFVICLYPDEFKPTSVDDLKFATTKIAFNNHYACIIANYILGVLEGVNDE